METFSTEQAAEMAGLKRGTFDDRAKRHGIKPVEFVKGDRGKPQPRWTMAQVEEIKNLRDRRTKPKQTSAVEDTSQESAQVITVTNHDDAPVEGKKIIANDGEKNSEQNNHGNNTTSRAVSQQLKALPAELLAQPRFFELYGMKKTDTPKGWSNPDNQRLFSELNPNRLLGFDTCGHDRADDYLVIDFDNVLDDDGEFVSAEAEDWYNAIKLKFGDCYCELSISKHGLHFIGKPTVGKFDAISNGKSGVLLFDKDNDVKIELFYKNKARYFLWTGNCYECDAQSPIPQGAIVDEIFQDLLDAIAKQNHVEETPKQPAKKHGTEKTAADLGNDYDLFRADIMLDIINPADLPDGDWLAVNSACRNIGVPYHVVDAFNRRDSKRYNEKENLERWNSATDPSFNIETLHGIAKRFGYSEADARRQWYQLHPEQNNNIVRTRDKIKDCPVDLILPENFIWTKQGISQLVPSKKDTEDFKKLPVTKTPIIITKKFREPSKGTVEFEIALRLRDKWNYTVMDGKTLAEARQLTELGNYDAIINDVGRLKQFFDALRACNPDLQEIKTYTKTGWTDDTFTTFAYPSNDYIIRRGGFDFDKALATRGNAELWKRKFIEVANKGGAVASLCIGTALAATLARPLNIANPQTHLQGTSGGGKTALLKFTASIFGNPRELIGTFAATNKNRQLVAAAFCDLPSFYDELETKGKKAEETLSTDVYNFADGKGNQANTRDGNARETFKFGGARLTTGERPILKQHDLRGAYKRLIQLDIHNNLFDDEFAADLHPFAEANFGHYAKQWIQFAQEHMQEIQAKYHHYSKRDPSTQQYEPTHLKSLSISLVAFEFFKVMLGVTDTFDATNLIRVRRYLLDNQLPTLEQIDDTARATESLRDFSASHEKFFMHETVNKPEFDNEFTQTAQVCYGKKFRNGEVAFYRTELTKILEVELGFASADKLISTWHEKGYLRHNEGKKSYVMYINGRNQRMICFKAGVIATAESEIKDDSVAS